MLVADGTISTGCTEVNRPAGKYAGIVGAFANLPHAAAHRDKGIAAGGNVFYADGHAAWIRFEKMKIRTDNNSGTSPAFWW